MRRMEICIDAMDQERLRPFWAMVLDYRAQPQPDGSIDLVDPEGVGPKVWFQHVPEDKTSKNRIHLDLYIASGERVELVRKLVALGGRVLNDFPAFTVMADPEGNEVCLCNQS